MENKTAKKSLALNRTCSGFGLLSSTIILGFSMFILLAVFSSCSVTAEDSDGLPVISPATGPAENNDSEPLTGLSEGEIAPTVKKVEVSGNRRVSTMIILSRIQTREGAPLSGKIISEDIKNIYALGYFSNISVESTPMEEGIKVTYILEEKPYVEKIELKGNRVIKLE